MNVHGNRSFFGAHLYNPGTPSRGYVEAIADGLLLLPGYLSNTTKVTLIKEETESEQEPEKKEINFRIDYCHNASTRSLLMFPAYLLSLPLEFIGKCIKNAALAMDQTAKTYNQITATHIQLLQDHEAPFHEIADLTNSLTPILLQNEVYDLIQEALKTHSCGFFHININIGTLVIKPIVNNEAIVDYDITSTHTFISWLPTTLDALEKHIQEQKPIQESLEDNLAKKLPRFGTASIDFEAAIKTLLTPEST